MTRSLQKLFPEVETVPLNGLYLQHDLRRLASKNNPFVYANFVSSLDGRIALAKTDGSDPELPDAIKSTVDTRLFLELAAPADAVIVSGQFMKKLADSRSIAPPPLEGDVPEDIMACRKEFNLSRQPVLVVISDRLDFEDSLQACGEERDVIVATTRRVSDCRISQLENRNVDILRSDSDLVDGRKLIAELSSRDLRVIYSVAGPECMATLLHGGVINRLYLTTALRCLCGTSYATFAKGPPLETPVDFELSELYLDPGEGESAPSLIGVFDTI